MPQLRRPDVLHPARIVPIAFLVASAVGTALLSLPVATPGPERPPLVVAAFTSMSAVSVTGLGVVDTATYWTPFGQAVILGLIQAGGFGIMTLATLLGLLVGGRLRLRSSLVAQVETHALNLGDVRHVVRRVAVTMALFEVVLAVVLTLRFRIRYDDTWADAAWYGGFYAVSAFCNGGFALHSDSITGFIGDPLITLTICGAVVAGALGFPVLFELRRRWRRPRLWTVNTRLTVYGYGLLFVVGTVAFWALEWRNPGTLAPLSVGEKALAGVTGSVMARSGGLNNVDYAEITAETMAVNYVLMFIGGGPAGTAGGIKVTTFFLLAFVIWSEVRGERDTNIGHRRIGGSTLRQALTVALLGVAVVALGTMSVLLVTDLPLDVVLFDAISAFATVGLSTGIIPELPASALTTLIVLMYVGRVGTITVASALALKRRHHHYHLPEERPIVG